MKFTIGTEVEFLIDKYWTWGTIISYIIDIPRQSEVSYGVDCYGEQYEIKESCIRTIK